MARLVPPVILVVALLLPACSGAPESSLAPTASAQSRKAYIDAVPIVYGSYLSPQPLSAASKTEMLTALQKGFPDLRAIWFIHVTETGADDDGRQFYRATVYERPMTASVQLRRGRCYTIDSARLRLYLRRPVIGDIHLAPGRRSAYVQVAPAGQRSDGRLTLPGREDLPFDPPEGLTDADVVSLAHLAHALADVGSLHAHARILGMHFDPKDQSCTVNIGSWGGPLAGQGTIITFRHYAGQWLPQPGSAMWVS